MGWTYELFWQKEFGIGSKVLGREREREKERREGETEARDEGGESKGFRKK